MSSAASRSRGAQLSGKYLRDLLLHEYLNKWIGRSERTRSGEVNYLAIAKVIADYVERHPTATRGRDTRPEKIKDLVHRALTGKVISQETLELLVDALGIQESHAKTLFDLWDDVSPARILIGNMPPAATSPQMRFETVQRHEFHYLGASGQPWRHRTVQAIRALVDGYQAHRYTFDMSEVTVKRVHGGTPSRPYQVHENLWAVDIFLPAVLSAGEIASMEFVTEFNHAEPVEPCFRYAAHQRVTDVMFRVEFHPSKLPVAVSWSEWKDYRIPDILVTHSEHVSLDTENAVSRHLDLLKNAVCGFTWNFER